MSFPVLTRHLNESKRSMKCSALVSTSFEKISSSLKQEIQKIISMPIQSAMKKASKQIRHSGKDLAPETDIGVLLIVNNGYSYLNADNFERVVVQRCLNDSNRINHAFCVTVDYHQGAFDAFIFCTARCLTIRDEDPWDVGTALADKIPSTFQRRNDTDDAGPK